ncbi:MerR family transcriptional regulator [Halopseudomonas bauzanensis]|nr:MerR family transcriptional regulator [Halopseudomonas bauzanensis]
MSGRFKGDAWPPAQRRPAARHTLRFIRPVQGHGFSIEKVLVLMALWRDGARSVMAYASGGSPSSSTDHARCVDQRNVALLRSCWSGATRCASCDDVDKRLVSVSAMLRY